ncbi:MAG: YihY/virulence factor BrkB family protein [Novosphingobium sp.]
MEEFPLDEPGTHRDLSPEARRKRALAGLLGARARHGSRIVAVIRRVWTGAYYDGFIHAGNLAYMSILALFPFFIVVAATFSVIGEPSQRAASIDAVLSAVPPMVAKVLSPVAHNTIEARSGWLLWIGCLVGLWTSGSLIETIRDILHRAYGTPATQAFWLNRLVSTALIFAAVILLLVALFAQVSITATEEVVAAWFPRMDDLFRSLTFSRLVTGAVLFLATYVLFLLLTPLRYRARAYPKWPGALLVTLWWVATTLLLPVALRNLFTYDLTYGSLAGVMIALFFFWLIGLGIVVGAELNAALAMSPEERDLRNLDQRETEAATDEAREGNE